MRQRELRARCEKPELRADEEGKPPKIVGYAAKYDEPTELWEGFHEVIRSGAFTKTISEANVRGVFNHDPSLLLGTTRAGTMRLVSDEVGLSYEIDTPDTSTGRDVSVYLERGDLYGSSFAFEIVKEARTKLENGAELREVLEVKLFDVGPVTFPAYEQSTASLRSLQEYLLTPAPVDVILKDKRDEWRHAADERALRIASAS